MPGGDLASLREEVQQLKGIVDVLTSATHLMAIPNASDVPGNAQSTSSHLAATQQLWSVDRGLSCGQKGGGVGGGVGAKDRPTHSSLSYNPND